jgi:hypothetical protein
MAWGKIFVPLEEYIPPISARLVQQSLESRTGERRSSISETNFLMLKLAALDLSTSSRRRETI